MRKRCYYPLACAEIASGTASTFMLDFAVPFKVDGLLASPERSDGLVVVSVQSGEKSLVASVGDVPVEAFYAGAAAPSFVDHEIPATVPLLVKVRNDAPEPRGLRLSVCGTCDFPPMFGLYSRRPFARWSRTFFWKVAFTPGLRLMDRVRLVRLFWKIRRNAGDVSDASSIESSVGPGNGAEKSQTGDGR